MKSNRSGRRYDREFKSNAVALVRGGRTITEVGRDLGVSKMVTGALGATGRGRPDAQRTQNAGFRDARTTRSAPSAAGTRVCESTARHLISEQVKLFFECGACKIAVYAFAHLKRVLRASFL